MLLRDLGGYRALGGRVHLVQLATCSRHFARLPDGPVCSHGRPEIWRILRAPLRPEFVQDLGYF